MTSRFYTKTDFDVHFSKRVPKGMVYFYFYWESVDRRKLGEPDQIVGEEARYYYNKIRMNPEDRWACPETPQARRRRAKRAAKK